MRPSGSFSQKPSLGEQGSVLLDQREEVRDKIVFGKDDSFSEQRAAFSAADQKMDIGVRRIACFSYFGAG